MEDKKKEESAYEGLDRTTYSKKVLIAAGIFIPIILILLFFGFAFKILLLILAAVLFASFFRGIAGFIHRYSKIPMTWSMAISVILVIGLFVLGTMLIAPQVSEQTNQLSQKLPEAVQGVKEQLKQSELGRKLVDQIPEDPQKWLQ